MVWVGVWVFVGVLGLVVLAVPAVRLWAYVRELGREVARVSDSLAAASADLERATRDLSRGSRG